MEILDDATLTRLVTPEVAVAAMREAVVAAWRGEFVAPARAVVPLGDHRMSFTCGAVPGDWFGYRSYVAPGTAGDEQVVVVQDEAGGRIRGLATGRCLGPRRTGAMGAVALEALAPADARAITLIGAGEQAWHQLWALPPRFRDVPVWAFSRRPSSTGQFVARARDELGLDVRAAPSLDAALAGADIVVLATSSGTPVLEVDDLKGVRYVATVGPKQVGWHEFPPDLARDAALAVVDSPAQVRGYDPPCVLADTDAEEGLVHLGAVVAGDHAVPDGRRFVINTGLAGTEAWLLNAVLIRVGEVAARHP